MRIRTERGAATRRRGWPERAARPRQAPAGGPGPRTLGRRGRGAVEPLRKAAPRSLTRLQKHLPRHPASLLVGLYPRNAKSKNARPYKGLDASVFTAARNQTRPSVSVDTRMDRQTAARPHGGLRPSGYKGWTTDACENPDGPRNDVPRGRRHDTQMGPFPGNQKTQPSPHRRTEGRSPPACGPGVVARPGARSGAGRRACCPGGGGLGVHVWRGLLLGGGQRAERLSLWPRMPRGKRRPAHPCARLPLGSQEQSVLTEVAGSHRAP